MKLPSVQLAPWLAGFESPSAGAPVTATILMVLALAIPRRGTDRHPHAIASGDIDPI